MSRFLISLLLLTTVAASAAPLDHSRLELEAAGGWALFKRAWVSSPSSQTGGAGLGPMFDARSCNACHAGGGAGPVGNDALGAGMVIRAGRADAMGDPVYGAQIQRFALPGFEPEADVSFHWNNANGLRTAQIDFAKLHYGDFASGTHTGLRRAPSLFGVALLEDIPESEIVAQAAHGGRPSWIAMPDGSRKLGRWGWKAATPELTSQIEIAFQRDFAISTSGRPDAFGECTAAETQCRAMGGNTVELPDESRDAIAAYLRLLRWPAPKNEASAGFAMFRGTGCADCHATLTDSKEQAGSRLYRHAAARPWGRDSTTASPKASRIRPNGAQRHCGTLPITLRKADCCMTAARAASRKRFNGMTARARKPVPPSTACHPQTVRRSRISCSAAEGYRHTADSDLTAIRSGR